MKPAVPRFEKRAPPKQPEPPPVKLPFVEQRTAPTMPGKTITSRLIKPVGAALLLLTSLAGADTTTVSAPQGNKGACPFPGCMVGTTSVTDVTQDPFDAPNNGAADATGAIQRAVDSGAAILYFPAGTYAICNLQPHAANQIWRGAGIGQTIFTGFGACNNLLATSANPLFPGPSQEFAVEDISFQGAIQNQLSLQCREMERIRVERCSFDTAGGIGINLQGCRDPLIRDNEFYSTTPGTGGRGVLLTGVRTGTLDHNTCHWMQTCFEIGTTANQPTEFTNVTNNIYDGTFWNIPTKYTNSGATVSYAGGVLTDTAASFAGLCGGADTPPASCAAAAGSFVRVLTARTTGTAATFTTGGGYLVDASKNFPALGVIRGDIIRTTPVCFGNGNKGPAGRFVCTGSAATGAWGDSCVCTANADCASNVCEPRTATVDTVGNATSIQVTEWDRDTTCALGATICPESTRRPTAPIITLAGVAYTIYGWTACQLTSYTATTITCNTDSWIAWNGSASTPANTTLYEVMYPRPIYFLLASNSNALAIQGLRVENNTAVGGFADHYELGGTRLVVTGNASRDCADTCFVFVGNQITASNNIAEHCGARGIIALGNDQTLTANIALDSPWVRTSNSTTAGDLVVSGLRNTLVGNKVFGDMPTNLNRYGMVSFGTSTDTQWVNNTCGGTYTVGCYRFDGAGNTLNHVVGYHGETISTNSATFSIEGGLATEAQIVATAPLAGSTLGCSDCNVAAPCTAGGTGAIAIRNSSPAWNCR